VVNLPRAGLQGYAAALAMHNAVLAGALDYRLFLLGGEFAAIAH
jgi:hypothetical protein